ncbi:MAG: glycosyltransferase family 4 protein [Bacteroidales bacterium]|nr:glycosyltransferase family 4 protein [Bacteroidales bacterium]
MGRKEESSILKSADYLTLYVSNSINTMTGVGKFDELLIKKFSSIDAPMVTYSERCIYPLSSKHFHLSNRDDLKNITPRVIIINSLGSHENLKLINTSENSVKILIVHESPRHFGPESYSKLSIEKVCEYFTEYDKVVFVSNNCKSEWFEHIKLDSKIQTYFIPNCCVEEEKAKKISKQDKTIFRERLDLEKNDFIVTCVASFQKRKGQDLLISEVSRMLQLKPNLQVLLIGHINDFQFLETLKVSIKKRGLEDVVQILGEKKNALEYIAASDLFILPSRAEAMPLTLLEAMLVGTPILASNVDGVPELIESKREGLLYNQDDKDGLFNAFEFMLNDELKIINYVTNARNKYYSRFSKNIFLESYQKLIINAYMENEDLIEDIYWSERVAALNSSYSREFYEIVIGLGFFTDDFLDSKILFLNKLDDNFKNLFQFALEVYHLDSYEDDKFKSVNSYSDVEGRFDFIFYYDQNDTYYSLKNLSFTFDKFLKLSGELIIMSSLKKEIMNKIYKNVPRLINELFKSNIFVNEMTSYSKNYGLRCSRNLKLSDENYLFNQIISLESTFLMNINSTNDNWTSINTVRELREHMEYVNSKSFPYYVKIVKFVRANRRLTLIYKFFKDRKDKRKSKPTQKGMNNG